VKKALLCLTMLLPVTGCSSVKTVGDGMAVGSAGGGIYATPIAAVGAALSVGADLFSPGGSSLTQDEMVEKAAGKWGKPHSAIETAQTIKLKESLSGDVLAKLSTTIDRAKEEAKTGHFQTNDKSAYIALIDEYDRGNWITITYPIENTSEKAIKMWCNKAIDQCMISTASEHPDLPALTTSAATLKKTLNGATASFGSFDAYEHNLSKVSCGLIGGVSPFMFGEQTFAGMVKKNLLKVVVDASGYAPDSSIKISGKLTKIDISVLRPEWNFGMELVSTNGKTLSVQEKYRFEFEFWNNHDKCGQIQDALPAAIKDLTEKIAKNPGFAELFRP